MGAYTEEYLKGPLYVREDKYQGEWEVDQQYRRELEDFQFRRVRFLLPAVLRNWLVWPLHVQLGRPAAREGPCRLSDQDVLRLRSLLLAAFVLLPHRVIHAEEKWQVN